MDNKEAIELLGKMSERTAVICIYRFVFRLDIKSIAEQRGISYYSCLYHIRKAKAICKRLDNHLEGVSAIQELFSGKSLNGFFIEKKK